eukprot:GEMP01012699.1.p1 GENE.GEMP01012699.1~~GEMP01012699.1.p1  ORF type:complete len:746 (+),score=192.60 GEMP01012699.1:320-2239(+)
MAVLNKIEAQSPEIADSVHGHFTKNTEEIGAGDQGHMFGYASNETTELMPLTHSLATKLGYRLTQVRKNGTLPWVLPDGKTQVTIEYKKADDGSMVPQRVHTLLISTQHSADVDNDTIRRDVMEHVIKPVVPAMYLDEDTIYHINPSGKFVIGGPHADAGLTGRKIIIDTYGGWGAHGGGAFSGKDSTKVDRSAAYAARWAAKSLVANGFAKRALVQVSYAIGIAQPLSMFVDTYGSATLGFSDDNLTEIVKRNFDFRPGCIMRDLKLREPMFQRLAAYGHFGREDLMPAWEVAKDLSAEIPKGCLEGVLLGMGNPLLDISAHVTQDFLTKYDLVVNNAILANEKHTTIDEELAASNNVEYIAGGATQNAIRVAQWQLGSKATAYMGAVGKDKYAEIMKRACEEDGVKVVYMETGEPTGTCGVCILDRERSLVANLSAAEKYQISHMNQHWDVVEKAKVIYSAGFFITVAPDAMEKVWLHCHEKNKKYCLNLAAPFIMQVPPFKAILTKAMPYVDYLFGNESEALEFAKSENWDLTDVGEIACRISMLPHAEGKPARIVVITQGILPTVIARSGHSTEYPVIALTNEQVIDTNGAGDAYAGGFLSQLVKGCSIPLCHAAGARSASVIVQNSGCTFPKKE